MRQLVLATVAAVVGLGLVAGQALADKVELQGVHLCCKRCVTTAGEVLGKVEGVSDAKCDQKARTILFTAKDEKTATAAAKALFEAGFFGKVSDDGKALAVEAPTPKKGDKAAAVDIKNVHLCCGQCKKAVTGLFKDAKVEFPGTNEVKITGKDLDRAEVLETLRKAGFNGTIDK